MPNVNQSFYFTKLRVFICIKLFPVSCFIRSTVSLCWVPWFCPRANYSTGSVCTSVFLYWTCVVHLMPFCFICSTFDFVSSVWCIQLKGHPEMYEGYVSMGYVDYLKKMSKYYSWLCSCGFHPKLVHCFRSYDLLCGWNRSGEWGDHVTLQAAADWVCDKVNLLIFHLFL